MIDLNFDEVTTVVTEHFRVCAMLGESRSVENRLQLSDSQLVLLGHRADESQKTLETLAQIASLAEQRKVLVELVRLGESLRSSPETGKAYRYSADSYFTTAAKLLGGLEPLPR